MAEKAKPKQTAPDQEATPKSNREQILENIALPADKVDLRALGLEISDVTSLDELRRIDGWVELQITSTDSRVKSIEAKIKGITDPEDIDIYETTLRTKKAQLELLKHIYKLIEVRANELKTSDPAIAMFEAMVEAQNGNMEPLRALLIKQREDLKAEILLELGATAKPVEKNKAKNKSPAAEAGATETKAKAKETTVVTDEEYEKALAVLRAFQEKDNSDGKVNRALGIWNAFGNRGVLTDRMRRWVMDAADKVTKDQAAEERAKRQKPLTEAMELSSFDKSVVKLIDNLSDKSKKIDADKLNDPKNKKDVANLKAHVIMMGKLGLITPPMPDWIKPEDFETPQVATLESIDKKHHDALIEYYSSKAMKKKWQEATAVVATTATKPADAAHGAPAKPDTKTTADTTGNAAAGGAPDVKATPPPAQNETQKTADLTLEEVVAKLGIDQSQIDAGLQAVTQAIYNPAVVEALINQGEYDNDDIKDYILPAVLEAIKEPQNPSGKQALEVLNRLLKKAKKV